MLRFIYHYVAKRGFLDGRPGFILCCLMAFYEFLSVVKREEARRTGQTSTSSAAIPSPGPERAKVREIPSFHLKVEDKSREVIAG